MERAALLAFFFCMPLCAGLVLFFIWSGVPNPLLFKIAASSFVLGLASFLVWAVSVTYRIIHALRR